MDLVAKAVRQQVETHLQQLVERALVPAEIAGSQARSPLVQTIRQFVLEGGKRLRPQLCLWSFLNAGQSEGNDELPVHALDVACAWELFHAFLLCHDDIIDGADRRRDRPTLHHRLALLDSGSVVFGSNLGIVAGDLLCVGAFRLLHGLDLNHAQPPLSAASYRQLLQLFTRVAGQTGFGQAVDIVQSHVPIGQVDEHTVMLGYHWKTAAYTFEGPMLSGALLAGLGEAACRPVSRFAQAIGQAYQLHNDLLDLNTRAHDGSDLVQGKRTPTVLRARAGMSESDKETFDEQVAAVAAGGTEAVERAERIRQHLLANGAVVATQRLVERLLDEAREAAEDPALPTGFSAALSGLLSALASKYFARVLMKA